MKASRPVTVPDGLFMLFAMLETLEHYPLEQLRVPCQEGSHEMFPGVCQS
jgi:hypothetical protein